MPEKQTREELLKAAKEEFLEKGYSSASLRSICKKANVTTGALYFFFKDKEDLFSSLVDETLMELCKIVEEHYNDEIINFENKITTMDNFVDDMQVAVNCVNYIYDHYDEFILLIEKSHGSKYENSLDEMIAITHKHYKQLVDNLVKYYGVKRMDDYIIHWFAHLQTYSFTELLTHNLSREEALKHIDCLVRIMINGWLGYFKL